MITSSTDRPERSVELSIVVPAYDERPSIAPLCREILEVLGSEDLEIVIVDDGSHDGTFDAVRELHAEDPRVRGVRLRTNSGKAQAYAAGFRAARGRLVATMDGDLQDDPRDLPRLMERVRSGADLVIGWKQRSKSSRTTFLLSKLLNGLLRFVTRMKLHDMNCPIRVMRREVADRLELRADLHRYIPLLAEAEGFRVEELPVENRPRQHGSSKYGGSKYLSSATAFLGMRLYLRFGERPMLLFGTLGLLAFLLGFAIDSIVAVRHLAFGTDIDDDIPTLVLGALLILIGTQFIAMGLLGEIMTRRLRIVEDQTSGDVAEIL